MGSVTKSQRFDKGGKKISVHRAHVRRAGVSASKVFATATAAKKRLRENEHGDALSAAAIERRGTLAV